MRASLITFLLGILIGVLPVMGQETVVQALTGTTNTTTPKFTVQDKWEVRWNAPGVLKVAVFSADGTLMTGGIATLNGSLYMPKGGTYYLQISMAKRPGELGANNLDKASHASERSAISGTMRYFALRLDNVSSWVPIDWRRFQTETTFLEQFHNRSRCLDSFLNTSDKTPPSKNSDALDPNLWSTDDKLQQANTNYIQQASGGDSSQRLDAERQLFADLVALADTDVSTVKDLSNFYSFNKDRAREEMAYRKALQDELDNYGNNMSRAGSMARKND